MRNILIISGHPNLDNSHANKTILDTLKHTFEHIEIRELSRLYPNFQIDVEAEQAALIKADIVVFQFPFYWYSIPGLLKHWIDQVFTYNFAYGSQGDKLKNKKFLLSFTIGAPADSYDPLSYNHFSIEEMIRPLQQTAYLSGMIFHKPIYTHNMIYIPGVYNELSDILQRSHEHAKRLTQALVEMSEK